MLASDAYDEFRSAWDSDVDDADRLLGYYASTVCESVPNNADWWIGLGFNEDNEAIVAGLIAQLHRWCDVMGLSWESVQGNAADYYQAMLDDVGEVDQANAGA